MTVAPKKRRGVVVKVATPESPGEPPASYHLDDVKSITRAMAVPPEVVSDGNVPVASVIFDKTDRIVDERDDASIEALAESLGMHGQLAPIVVVREEAELYRVVCGRRRLLAAKRRGWTHIWARVLKFKDPIDLLAYRETENLQRLDLTPIEEAVAVAHMLDLAACGFAKIDPTMGGRKYESFDVITRQRAVAFVAAQIGKPERWVRDRSFMVRLDESIREKVMAGTIPMGHAREIAKLADARVRAEAAKWCFGYSGRLRELDDLREFVAKHLYSLAQVSFRLDVAFEGKPSCVECPHNSANQPGLFEHSAKHVSDPAEGKKYQPHLNGKEPKAGVCTLPACYQAKAAAASRAIASTASAAIRASKAAKPKDRPKAKAEAIAAAKPSFVAKSVVEERIQEREQIAKNRPKSPGSGGKPVVHAWDKPEYKARQEFRSLMAIRARKLEKLIDAHFQKARPGQWAMLQLAMKSKPMEAAVQFNSKKAAKAIESREFKAMLEAMVKPPTIENLLAVEKYCGTRFAVTKEISGTGAYENGVYDHIAAAFGIKLDEPAPTYEAVLASLKGEKPAAAPEQQPAAIAKKRAASKKPAPVDDEDEQQVEAVGAEPGDEDD